MIKLSSLLKEYSDKTINGMIQIYKPQTKDSEDQIRANIKRFQQLTDALAKKLQDNNPVVLNVVPDELKQSNKFRDITLYKDYNTFLRVLKAIDTKPVDIYKQAIEFYKRQNQYEDPRTIGNYVARFKQNLNALIEKVEDKDEEALRLIPKELLRNDAYKNILNWHNFQKMEHVMDGLFPLINTGDGSNDAETDADLVYKNDTTGIEIYKGDEEHKCIRYSKGYSWCIGRSMYANYRYMQSEGKNRMFYFVFDRTQPKENRFHVVVIHVNEKGLYTRTTSRNDGDEPYGGIEWKNFGKSFEGTDGQRLWNKIKDLQKYFPFIKPNKDELRRLGFRGKKLTLDSFVDLDLEDKIDWLRANAEDRNIVTPEIVKSLPAFGDASKNDLINYNREFSFNELKSNVGLLKRYPDYRFTRFPNTPIPYEFIPYLKPDLQELYYEKFEEGFLTFDEIEKYFSKDVLRRYIDEKINEFFLLPEEATKYMNEDQIKLYEIYKLSYSDIQYFGETSSEDISAPPRMAMIPELSYYTFKNIESKQRQKFLELIKKIGSNINNIDVYNKPGEGGFFTGIPVMFEYKGNFYFITPLGKDQQGKDNNDKWVIISEDGTLITTKPLLNQPKLMKNKKVIPYNNNIEKQAGSKTYWVTQNEFDSINDGEKDINLNILKEAILESDHIKYKFKYLAGIIK